MRVYFDGNFRWHEKYQRACRSLSVREAFTWKGYTWHLLGAYVCNQGLVLDFAKEIPTERIREFVNKIHRNEKWLEFENPMETNLQMKAWINGRQINSIGGNGKCHNPLAGEVLGEAVEIDEDVEELLEHYELDRSCGWYFWRMSLRWEYKRIPKRLHLKLGLEPDQYKIPCEQTFCTENGQEEQRITFTHPLNKTEHALVVTEVNADEIAERAFAAVAEFIFPRHLQSLQYYMEKAADEERFILHDMESGDTPIRKMEENEYAPEGKAACSVAIIGRHKEDNPHGPASIFLAGRVRREAGDNKVIESNSEVRRLRYQASRLCFQPVEHTRWQIEAIVTQGEHIELEWNLSE